MTMDRAGNKQARPRHEPSPDDLGFDISKARLVRRGPARPARFPLRGLRESAGTTQAQVSKISGLAQPDVSKLESAETLDDRQVSTIRRYLAALGDELELVSVSKYGHRIGIASATRVTGDHPQPPPVAWSAEGLRDIAKKKNATLLARLRTLMAKLQTWEELVLLDVTEGVGHRTHAIETALASVDDTVIDRNMLVDLVRKYGAMVAQQRRVPRRNWAPDPCVVWTAETTADAVLSDMAPHNGWAFAAKLRDARKELVAAIEAASHRGGGARGQTLSALLAKLGMAVGTDSAMRMARSRLRRNISK
jgi:transcriptional regulator with XRE-family HTH domain